MSWGQEQLIKHIAETYPDAILWDGLDAAIIGMARRCGMEPVVAYDYHKCIRIFQDQGMEEHEAIEYFEFNVAGAYVGENTPIIVED
jgi:hypothetical protein